MRLRPYIHTKDYETVHKWINDERIHALWCANLIPYPMTEDAFRNALEKDAMEWDGCAFVATDDDGTLLGFFVLSENVSDNSGFIKMVVVNHELRGRGYGDRMIKLLQKYAFEIAGVSSLRINVFGVNKSARKCYVRNGFAEDGFTPNAITFHDEIWGRYHMVLPIDTYHAQLAD